MSPRKLCAVPSASGEAALSPSCCWLSADLESVAVDLSIRSTPMEFKTSRDSPSVSAGTLSFAKQVTLNVSMSRCHRHT